ncbi:Uncharacterised protein [Streptococcus pneumoniae]|nr:Uncharacterised protein [Streptococcus pneumoniae]
MFAFLWLLTKPDILQPFFPSVCNFPITATFFILLPLFKLLTTPATSLLPTILPVILMFSIIVFVASFPNVAICSVFGLFMFTLEKIKSFIVAFSISLNNGLAKLCIANLFPSVLVKLPLNFFVI